MFGLCFISTIHYEHISRNLGGFIVSGGNLHYSLEIKTPRLKYPEKYFPFYARYDHKGLTCALTSMRSEFQAKFEIFQNVLFRLFIRTLNSVWRNVAPLQ